ncbi:MAG: hypothetical protein ABJC04_02410 [Verrucomicrobiota bacterium]
MSAGLFFACVLNAAKAEEPVVSTNETKNPLASKKKSWLDELMPSYRPGDTLSGRSNNRMVAPPLSAPPPVMRAKTARELEAADREKNWIFLKPGEQKKEEIPGFDPILRDKTPKSVVMQFLENQELSTPVPSGRTNNSFGEHSSFDPIFNLDDQTTKSENRLGSSPRKSFEYQLPTYGATEVKLADFMREQRELHSNKDRQEKADTLQAYENLFKPSGASSSSGESFSSLNNPDIFGQRPSALPSRLTPLDGSPSPLAQAPLRPFAGIPGAANPDPGTRVFGVSSAPVPAAPPSRPVQQPSVLPSPKRKF